MNNKDLLPCPFCAQEPVLVTKSYGRDHEAPIYYYCMECAVCGTRTPWYKNMNQPFSHWNKRTNPSDL